MYMCLFSSSIYLFSNVLTDYRFHVYRVCCLTICQPYTVFPLDEHLSHCTADQRDLLNSVAVSIIVSICWSDGVLVLFTLCICTILPCIYRCCSTMNLNFATYIYIESGRSSDNCYSTSFFTGRGTHNMPAPYILGR